MEQPQNKKNKKIEVAVVGGGVCGLTLAIALQKAGVAVQLFEAAAAFGEIGAGLGVGPNAMRVLERLGLMDAVMEKCSPADLRSTGFIFRTGVGEHQDYPLEGPHEAGLGIHRAVFLDALVELVDPAICHFHKRCTHITASPADPARMVVHFLDGTTHEADVVLGADGIKSVARKFVLGDAAGADNRTAFSNTVAYRGLVPYDKLREAGFKTDLTQHPGCFVGPDRVRASDEWWNARLSAFQHFILFTIKNGETVNVVAFHARYDIPIGANNLPDGAPWVERVSRDELKRVYEGWGPDVATLLDCMPEQPSKWSIHVVHPPLDTYVRGRVALLGDAAHGMLPHLGAGAGQGIEDAYMLARLLSHPHTNNGNIEAVLQVYSQIRRPRAQMVWDRSRLAGRIYDGNGPHGTDWAAARGDLEGLWTPVWRHGFDDEFGRVVGLLQERGAFPSAAPSSAGGAQ
ncbi:FAD/NAD-P-binding domain-containing protein [Trametes elegans]|nr:FAD/NAD-P-binding domain-containing protein [Trametes elegans]